jgi:nucleotide-binding universal stress UspA family protein
MKIQRVCVAVKDLSESTLGIDVVRAMAADDAEVLLVHVSARENFGRARFPLEDTEEASLIAEAALSQFGKAGITAQAKVCRALVGKESDAIVKSAAEWGADTIVLGHPHGGEFVARMRGSVVQRVVLSSQCPVIVASIPRLGTVAPAREQVMQVA